MSKHGARELRLLIAAGLFALTGCATNTVTGRNQFLIVSEQTAMKGSASAYSNMLDGLGKKGQVEAETPRALRVREITDRLIAQAVRFRPDSSRWDWQLSVINDPKTVNAFCMAGGKMAIYTGMWEKLNATDDEIANVMGHEIGHALANHTQERMSVAITASVGASVLAALVTARSSGDTGSALRNEEMFATAAALAVTLPNSREGESEADQIGIELAARAGYDPNAAVTLWEKMGKLGGAPPEFMSTHPSPVHRMENLKALGGKVEPYYVAAKKAGPDGNVPSFLTGSVNERVPGTESRDSYAARVSGEADTLSFVSEPFDKFKRGETVFECRSGCSAGYLLHRGDWKKLHGERAWRDLAVSVLQVGYLNDLSYFMLGEAARGLDMPIAARRYYSLAVEADRAGFGCGAVVDSCMGFAVQQTATAAIK